MRLCYVCAALLLPAAPLVAQATADGQGAMVELHASLRSGVRAKLEDVRTEMCAVLAELKGGRGRNRNGGSRSAHARPPFTSLATKVRRSCVVAHAAPQYVPRMSTTLSRRPAVEKSQPIREPLLRTRRLSKVNERGTVPVHALHEVNLDVAQGELLVVMGNSGSGKSALLYVLSGLERSSEGEIHFDGRRIDHMDETECSVLRRQGIGFVFQAINLIPHLTLFENAVRDVLASRRSWSRRARRGASVWTFERRS